MTPMRRQSLVAYGAPLCETVVDCPQPTGTEVLVRIERCGVCHSDLHMQDGYFKLGGDKRLDVRGGRTLPFTLGHEIAGRIDIEALVKNTDLGALLANSSSTLVTEAVDLGRSHAVSMDDTLARWVSRLRRNHAGRAGPPELLNDREES